MTEQVTTKELKTFDLGSALDGFAHDISRLEEHFQTHTSDAATGSFPDWWGKDDLRSASERDIRASLDTDDGTPVNIGRYYVLAKRLQSLKHEALGRGKPDINIILNHKALAKGLSGENESCTQLRADFLDELVDEAKVSEAHMQALKAMFGLSSHADLLALKGEKGTFDSSVHTLLRSEKNLAVLRSADRSYLSDDEEPIVPSIEEWSVSVAMSFGFSRDEAQKITFTLGKTNEAGLLRTITAIDHFGVEGIRKIASGLPHVWGFDWYSLSQLESMARMVDDSSAEAQRLSSHDVTALLINRAGDARGVLIDTAKKIEGDETSGRIVFGEIFRLHHIRSTLEDFNKAGIKPSTVVIATHSNVLTLGVGDGYPGRAPKSDHAVVATAALVNHLNDTRYAGTGVVGYALMEMDDISRIVSDYMQPSRGIDDPTADIGRKKIVLVGCGLGKEGDIKGMNDQKEVIILGQGSFASELGRHLFEMGVRDVDIYAAPDYTQIDKTGKGIKYTATPNGFDFDRPPQKAVLIRVTDEGVERFLVDEVLLRK